MERQQPISIVIETLHYKLILPDLAFQCDSCVNIIKVKVDLNCIIETDKSSLLFGELAKSQDECLRNLIVYLGAYILSLTMKSTLCTQAMCATNNGATSQSLDNRV